MITFPNRFPIKFCSSTGTDREVFSPNDRSILTRVQYATAEDVSVVLAKLPNGQKSVARLKVFERALILKKVATMIEENSNELAWLISSEGGKPLKDARVEVARAQNTIETCREELLRSHGETVPMERTPAGQGHLAITQREPIGPVLAISAFNHPLNLLAHQVGCAVASGNAVVIKPAPNTPLSAIKLESFFEKAGIPNDSLFVVNADVPEIEMMLRSTVFSYVSFIGSAKVGWGIRKILAPGTRLSLEHGGQAPAIVRKDARLELAIPQLLKGAFYHAGQVCISTQRIFIHQDIFPTFLQEFKKQSEALITGDARHEKTDVGPLIRPEEVARISQWLDEAKNLGATVLFGEEVRGTHGQYLLPTALVNVPRTAKLMKDEIFGPVVCLNSYTNEEELLAYLNSNDYIFEASLYTENLSKALQIAQELTTMTLMINNHTAFRVDWMPFGGHKLSGLGMGGVKYMMEEMTRLKQIIIRVGN